MRAELQAGGWRDPVVNLIQWLGEQGDPYTYAPYILRHRTDGFEEVHFAERLHYSLKEDEAGILEQ